MNPKYISSSIFALGATGKPVQFVREEVYAIAQVCRHKNRKTGEPNPPKPTGRAVIGELIREASEYYRHLTAKGIRPIPPRLLWGIDPQYLVKWYEELETAALLIKVRTPYKNGCYERRQRTSTSIFLSAVASYPSPPDNNSRDYRKWRLHTVAWAKRHYGDRLVSVCEHLDEEYGHVHCLVAHPDAQSARSLHSGHSAADQAKAAGASVAEQNKAYRAALTRYQDEFFDRVGRRCGLDRLSQAPKPRLSYSAAKLQRELELQIGTADTKLALRKKTEEIRAQKIWQDHEDRMRADRALLAIELSNFDAEMAALAQERSDVAKALAQLEEASDEVSRILAIREEIYRICAEAVREGVTSQAVVMQILTEQEWSTAPLVQHLGRLDPSGR